MIKFRRLQVLETFLRTRAAQVEGRFDLERWVSKENEVYDEKLFPNAGLKVELTVNSKMMDCGFAGCAIGWAGVLPSFNRLGFHLRRDESSAGETVYPAYDVFMSFGAVEEFFGISYRAASYLFLDISYPNRAARTNPLAVAERIREFIQANVPANSPCKYVAKHLQSSN